MKFKHLFVPAAALAIALTVYTQLPTARADEEEPSYTCTVPNACPPVQGCIDSHYKGSKPGTERFTSQTNGIGVYLTCQSTTYPGDAGKSCTLLALGVNDQDCGTRYYYDVPTDAVEPFCQKLYIEDVTNYPEPGVDATGHNCGED